MSENNLRCDMRNLFFLILAFISSPVFSQESLLRLQGSNTIGAELGPELVTGWLQANHYRDVVIEKTGAEEQRILAHSATGDLLQITIAAHGSTTGFRGLLEGQADIAMSSRPIKDKEIEQLKGLGRMNGPQSEFVVGLDGIAVIVHPENSLARIDKAQLQQIFSGKLRDWSQLGGTPGPIQLYARDDNSGTFDTFKSLVLGKKFPLSADARRFESNAELSDAVAHDGGGIGFVGLPYIHQSKALAVADDTPLAIAPNRFTVATEDYALARRLYFYLPENATAEAHSLVEYALSQHGQQVVADSGFVSQEIISGTLNAGVAHAEYYLLVKGAERLSLNFRFTQGSAFLDNKARRDIQRLADYLEREENHRRELILVGFSDSNEAIPMQSLGLSIQRADGVADVLLGQGVVPTRVRGYGPAVTVASNANAHGREKNRRVEVWLR
jgi:phosphate transport system substrate-binding protein